MDKVKKVIQASVVEVKGLGFFAAIHEKGQDPADIVKKQLSGEKPTSTNGAMGPFGSIEDGRKAGSRFLEEYAKTVRSFGGRSERTENRWGNDPEAIAREEFHIVVRDEGHPQLHDEREWYRFKDTFGVVIFDKVDKDWSYVVAAYDAGRYRGVDLGVNSKTIEDARCTLFQKMRAWSDAHPRTDR